MKNIVIICKYLALACFLAILSLEVVFRIIRKEQWVKHTYPKIYVADTICGYKGVPNIEGHIQRPSIDKYFRLNNQGFYGPDFSKQKPDSIYRIIITGSSWVEGIWSNHKESFPFKLHKLFKKNGYNVEVINCAISGNDRDLQNINLIEHYLINYEPDLILHEGRTQIKTGNFHRDKYKDYSILFAGDNMEEKAHSRFIAEREVDRIHQLKLFTDFWDISYLLRFIVRRSDIKRIPSFANCLQIYIENKAESWNYSRFKTYNFSESIDILNRLNQRLKIYSCKLILFEYNSSQKKKIFMNKDKIEFSYIFLNISGNGLSHEYDGHPNEKAHEKTAHQLYNKLSQYFIPPKFSPTKEP
jgi:hypothetical protein